jgi:hypothetical protein
VAAPDGGLETGGGTGDLRRDGATSCRRVRREEARTDALARGHLLAEASVQAVMACAGGDGRCPSHA